MTFNDAEELFFSVYTGGSGVAVSLSFERPLESMGTVVPLLVGIVPECKRSKNEEKR
jgi:hypothetical protein